MTGTYLDDLPETLREQILNPPQPQRDQSGTRPHTGTYLDDLPDEIFYGPRQLDVHGEVPSEFLARRSIPFVSATTNLLESREYSRLRERQQQGIATGHELQIIADFEGRQRLAANRPFGNEVLSALAHVPAIAGEAYVAGQVGAGLGMTARAPSIAAAITSPASWGRNAFMTAAMPSMWMPQWSETNIRAGRDAMDPRGLPSAYAMGFLNTAVLGSLGPVGEVSGQSVFNTARNVLAATGRGMLEQQGVDIMASAVSEALPEGYKLETGYGLLGAAVRSPNQFWRQAATQAITFAAFSIMHQRPGELETFTDLTRSRAREGVSASEAAKEVLAIQADPAKFTESKDVKVRNYAEALQMPAQGPQPGLEAMPEGRAPRAPMPGEMLPERPERPERESVRPAPEPPVRPIETKINEVDLGKVAGQFDALSMDELRQALNTPQTEANRQFQKWSDKAQSLLGQGKSKRAEFLHAQQMASAYLWAAQKPEPPAIAPETRTPEQASTAAQERPGVQASVPEHPMTRREWIDKERQKNPYFAPDIESSLELLTPKQRAEVERYNELKYKTVALQGPENGYKPYKLTKAEKAELADLDAKYRGIFVRRIEQQHELPHELRGEPASGRAILPGESQQPYAVVGSTGWKMPIQVLFRGTKEQANAEMQRLNDAPGRSPVSSYYVVNAKFAKEQGYREAKNLRLQEEPKVEPVPSAPSKTEPVSPERTKQLKQLIRQQRAEQQKEALGESLKETRKTATTGALNLTEEHTAALKAADLPLNERRALEAQIVGGESLREYAKKAMVSQQTIKNRAEAALRRLNQENPSLWKGAETVEELAMDLRLADAERLIEKGKLTGQAELSNVGEKAKQAEGLDRAALIDQIERDIDARLETNKLYQKEIEASREQILAEGKRQGRSREEVERAAKESYQQALAAEAAQRQNLPEQASSRPTKAAEPVPAAEQRLAPPAEPVLGGGQADLAKPYQRETALANAVTEKERELRQETPLEAAARQDNPTTWQMAKDAIARDPAVADRLVAEVLEKPRPLKTEEQAVLLHEKINLSNQYDALVKEYMKAKGERALQLETDERLLMAKRDRLDQAIHKTGTELGRSLAFRRQLAASDYTLQGMLFGAQKAKGEKLTPEETAKVDDLQKRIDQTNKALERRIKEVEERIANEDFEPKQKKERATDEKTLQLEMHLKDLKTEFNQMKDKFEYQKKSAIGKAWHWLTEGLNFQRSFFLGADAPPVFRQGMFFTMSHPVQSAMSLVDSFKAFKSKEGAYRLEKQVENHPEYKDAVRAGVDFLSTEGPLSGRPEEFRSEYIGKVPVFGGLLRWNVAYQNMIKLRYFELLRRSATGDGAGSEAELKAIANAVNVLTGRGKLPGSAEQAVPFFSHIFMSPRWTWSRFQALVGQPLWYGNTATRLAVGKEYARTAIGLGLLLGGAALLKNAGADVDVSLDPRSADFGKIKTGNTRIDPYGGVQQALVVLSRLGSGQTVGQNGVVHNIRRTSLLNPMAPPLPPQFGQQTAYDTATSFARGRFTPALGATVDVLSGQNMVGEPVPLYRGGIRLVTPLTISDVYDGFNDLGIPRGTATSIWAIFGGGLQSNNRLSRR